MKKCRSLSGLLKAIERHEAATLLVYAGTTNQALPGTWAACGDAITLNLGNGRYAQISKKTYERVKDRLTVLS